MNTNSGVHVAVRGGSRGVAGGGGAVGGRRRARRWRGRPPLLRAGRPPGRAEGPARQVAPHQPGPRCVLWLVVRLGRRGGFEWGALGRREAALRGPGDPRGWSRRLLCGHRRQGFQNACSTAGGSVSHRGGARLLLTTYYVLYFRQTLLQKANKPQGKQKGILRGRRGGTAGGRQSGRGPGAVLTRTSPRRLLLRRIQSLQRRGGRASAQIPHQYTAPADRPRATGGITTKTAVTIPNHTNTAGPGSNSESSAGTSVSNDGTYVSNSDPRVSDVGARWPSAGQAPTPPHRLVRGRSRRRAGSQPRAATITKQ